MYIGRYYHQIEEKGRVSLPKKFRAQENENFVITRGLDGGLFIYPEHAWQETIQKLSEKTETKKRGNAITYYWGENYLSNSTKQRDFADLTKNFRA